MEGRDIPPAQAPAPEPIWERRRRESVEADRELQKFHNRRFVRDIASTFAGLSGVAVVAAAGGLPDGLQLSATDYLFVALLLILSAAIVWLVTRVESNRPARHIWMENGGFFAVGVALMLAVPFLDPVLEKLFP